MQTAGLHGPLHVCLVATYIVAAGPHRTRRGRGVGGLDRRAAYNDAKVKVEARVQEEMSKLTGGLQLPPGFKMPFG